MVSGIEFSADKKASKILVIDDDTNFLLGVSRTLTKANFEVIGASNGSTGILKAKNEQPDLILLDVNMPKINGFQVKNALDNNPNTQYIPTIFLTALSDRISKLSGLCAADDYITKPVDADILIARIKTILRRVESGYKLAVMDSKKPIFSFDNFQHLGQSVEIHDYGTAGHTHRVTCWFVALAKRFGFTGLDLENARKGAILHDLGKLAIVEEILNKPGPLTEEEWIIMRKHPELAADMLKNVPHLQSTLDIPRYHHERWDGKGYPHGLGGEAIPLTARIFSVVDVYDALRTKRPYKAGLDEKVVLDMIRAESGRQFDPRIVNHFLTNFHSIKKEVTDDCITNYPGN